jgi:alkylation response protein AidB-like acyl-CoA dehydrogenase
VSRLGNASQLLGFARRALADGIAYARTRMIGTGAVTDFQGIQWTIADCYSALYAASLARDQAANLAQKGHDPALATSLAKYLAVNAAEKATSDVYALIGGHGLYEEQPYSQHMLDVKLLRVAGGSLEVLKNYVAKTVLKSADLAGLD